MPIIDPSTRVTGIAETSPGLVASVERIEKLGRPIWVLEGGYDPPVELGMQRGFVEVDWEREGQAGRPLRIPVTGSAVGDIQSNPARLILVAGRDAPERFEGSISLSSLLEGHRLKIEEARVSAGHEDLLQASFEPEAKDGAGRSRRWTVRLTTTAPLQESVLNGELSLKLDDPQNPKVVVPYVIHTR